MMEKIFYPKNEKKLFLSWKNCKNEKLVKVKRKLLKKKIFEIKHRKLIKICQSKNLLIKLFNNIGKRIKFKINKKLLKLRKNRFLNVNNFLMS